MSKKTASKKHIPKKKKSSVSKKRPQPKPVKKAPVKKPEKKAPVVVTKAAVQTVSYVKRITAKLPSRKK